MTEITLWQPKPQLFGAWSALLNSVVFGVGWLVFNLPIAKFAASVAGSPVVPATARRIVTEQSAEIRSIANLLCC